MPVSLDDKAYALRPKPKKNGYLFIKNPTSGLDGPWATLSFVFGRFRVLNREIGQIWDGAAWLRTKITKSGLYWDLLVGLFTVLMAG